MPERLIVIEGLNKSFSGVHALKDVRFDFPSGGKHALAGDNGSVGFVDLVHDDKETWNPSAEQQEQWLWAAKFYR
ncbi:MAG: hypothetical protein ABSF43_03020 [Rectinemataceae bacterium]|jgi:ABC-type uncharacterized transport system ATPase subunit